MVRRRRRNCFLIISLTLLCSLIVHGVETTQPVMNEKFFSFPLAIGDWSGREVTMSEYVYEITLVQNSIRRKSL